MTTLLVAGPRDWSDMTQEVMLWHALEKFSERYGLHEIVHGGAQGADWITGRFAETRPEVQVSVFRPDWRRYGKAAGPRRNGAMVEYVIGQATEHGAANVFAMLCHASRSTWTPGTGSTYRILRDSSSIVPVLVTHVTRTEIYEEALG